MQYDYTQGPFYIPPDKNPVYRRAERRNLARLCFGVLTYLLVSSFLAAAMKMVLPLLFPKWGESQGALILIQSIPAYCIGFPLFWLMLSGCPKKRIEKKPLSFQEHTLFLAVTFTALFLGNIIGNLLTNLFNLLSGEESQSVVGNMMDVFSPLTMLILSVVLAPIFEELLFRKILLERLLPYSERLAVILSALLFGLIHGNIQQFFYAFFVGCVFGYVYIKTGKIRYTIGMHMLLNFTGGFIHMLFQRQSNTTTALSASINLWEIIYGFYNSALLILCLVGLIYFIRNRKNFSLSATGARALSLKSQFQLAFGNIGMVSFLVISVISFIANLLTLTM